MKVLLVFAVGLGLVSCARDAATSSPQNTKISVSPKEPTVPYTLASTYATAGKAWRLIVIKGPISDPQLIALARELHRMYDGESIDIFDDPSQIRVYEQWDKHYPKGAYPYPKKWVNKHHIAMINRMLAPGGATWQLFGGAAHPTSPESKIVDLE